MKYEISIYDFSKPSSPPETIVNENKPGKIYPSKMTDDFSYDTSNEKRGIALIFNHEFDGEKLRKGTIQDGTSMIAALKSLQFEVRYFSDKKLHEIKDILHEVSLEDHSNNDCFLVTVMTHGGKGGQIDAADRNYSVQVLWENFLGENCKTLIGKPKLFFIQACRGDMVDFGVLLYPKPIEKKNISDEVDAQSTKPIFVIPTMADVLVMYSTLDGHAAFRSPVEGAWFIQVLCKELNSTTKLDLLHILTRVINIVSFAHQSNIPDNEELDAAKQSPIFFSTLTKTLNFPLKPTLMEGGQEKRIKLSNN